MKENGINTNGRIMINDERHVCEKDYVWNPTTCDYENGKCFASIINDSAVTRDETIK